jgi:hypothetical protein
MLLDWWLGIEGIPYLREREVRSLVLRSAASGGDIGRLEAIGARNFFDLDDVPVTEEGEPVHAQSIISLPLAKGRCLLPKFNPSPDDPFLRRIDASGMKWVIVTDPGGEPVFVLDSHHFLRDALFDQLDHDPTGYWHRPIIVRDMQTKLGEVIGRMRVAPERPGDDVIDNDLILVWGAQKRIITGADLLGRLLRDIVTVDAGQGAPAANERAKIAGRRRLAAGPRATRNARSTRAGPPSGEQVRSVPVTKRQGPMSGGNVHFRGTADVCEQLACRKGHD